MSVPCEMLLHPELLTNEQLISIIRDRHLHITNLDYLHRDDLLDVFHNYCVPHGQRKYRDTGRGKVLNQARKSSPEPVKLNVNYKQYLNCRYNNECNRLKPPPDILSGHLKRIKLDIKTQALPDVNVAKRKMSVDSVTLATDSPPPKKGRKPITWP